MKITLMIEASKETLAQVLQSLPDDAVATVAAPPSPPMPTMPAVGNAPSTGTSTAEPASNASNSAETQPAGEPTPSDDNEDDDDGPADANAPELDADGLPWDERIHSSNKATNKDGTWRARRGVTESVRDEVTAELRQRMQSQPSEQAQQPTPPQGDNQQQPELPTQPVPMPQGMPMTPTPQQQEEAPTPQPMPMPQGDNQQQAPGMQPIPQGDNQQPAQPAPQAETPAPPPQQQQQQQQQAATDASTGAIDFHGFMAHLSSKMGQTDESGQPLIGPDYLSKITGEIGTAFGVQMNAITDVASDPQKVNYAVQLLQRDGKW